MLACPFGQFHRAPIRPGPNGSAAGRKWWSLIVIFAIAARRGFDCREAWAAGRAAGGFPRRGTGRRGFDRRGKAARPR